MKGLRGVDQWMGRFVVGDICGYGSGMEMELGLIEHLGMFWRVLWKGFVGGGWVQDGKGVMGRSCEESVVDSEKQHVHYSVLMYMKLL